MGKEELLASILRVWLMGERRYDACDIPASAFYGSWFDVEITDEIRSYLIRAMARIGELYPGSIHLMNIEFDGESPQQTVGRHNLTDHVKDPEALENLIYSGQIVPLDEAS